MSNSKEMDLISVIIPVYKVEKFLEKCIKSIQNQTYSNIEIILVEDGSPDNCGKICDDYEKKDRRIRAIHKTNGGLSDARNFGIDEAKGKYITFIDSDDFVDNIYVEELYNTLVSYDADMAIGAHRVLYGKKVIDKGTNECYCTDSKTILKTILYDDGIDLSAWAKLYKIELFKNIRFPKGRLYEDAATTYKLVDLSNKIAVKSIAIYNYVIRKDSISNNNFSEKKLDLITSTKEMTEFIKKEYPELVKGCDRRLMYAYLSTLTQLAKSKKENQLVKKELMEYIKKNKKNVLKDKNVPKRDKIGIYSLQFGFNFYKIMWNFYSKFTGRY